jgi:hypothetical protein
MEEAMLHDLHFWAYATAALAYLIKAVRTKDHLDLVLGAAYAAAALSS